MVPLLLLALAAFMVSPRSIKKDISDSAKRLSSGWTNDLGDLLRRRTPIRHRFSTAMYRMIGVDRSVFK